MCFFLSEFVKNNKYSKYFANGKTFTRLSQMVTNSNIVTTNSNVSDENSVSSVHAKVRLKPTEQKILKHYRSFTKFRDYFRYYKTAVKIFPEKKPDTRLKEELNGKIYKFLSEKTKSDLNLMRNIIRDQMKTRFKKNTKRRKFRGTR